MCEGSRRPKGWSREEGARLFKDVRDRAVDVVGASQVLLEHHGEGAQQPCHADRLPPGREGGGGEANARLAELSRAQPSSQIGGFRVRWVPGSVGPGFGLAATHAPICSR